MEASKICKIGKCHIACKVSNDAAVGKWAPIFDLTGVCIQSLGPSGRFYQVGQSGDAQSAEARSPQISAGRGAGSRGRGDPQVPIEPPNSSNHVHSRRVTMKPVGIASARSGGLEGMPAGNSFRLESCLIMPNHVKSRRITSKHTGIMSESRPRGVGG